MKTLDEVIKGVETYKNIFAEKGCFDCHYRDEDCINSCFLEDALRYLKEYRDRKETLRNWTEKAISEQQNVADAYMLYKIASEKKQENLPLTWQELQHMEGKPVWLEYNFQIGDKEFRDKSKRWCIIGEFKPWHDTEITITENGFVLSKNEQIKCWQAYRKERS